MDHIRGVRLIDLKVFHDGRGDLVALEQPSNLPFTLRRVFYMTVDSADIRRAKHATSSDLFLTIITGSVMMDVDNGEEQASLSLVNRERGVWTRPGIYITLREFSADTVLLVCASAYFKDTLYFQAPQPDLIEPGRDFAGQSAMYPKVHAVA